MGTCPQPGSGTTVTDAGGQSAGREASFDEDVSFDEPTVGNYLDDLNPHSRRIVSAYVEPALAGVAAEERYQFERHGYFIADVRDHAPGKPVFNDSWAKGGKQA